MAAAALKNRVLGLAWGPKGAPATPLGADLQRATHGATHEVPVAALEAVIRASHEESSRREIMQHLRECLSATSSSHWRRVYAGIIVLEELLEKGSPELVSETACGMHFDLPQRLAFLERYEYGYDHRVEALLRRRATNLRGAWLAKQLALEVEGVPEEDPVRTAPKQRAVDQLQEDSTTDEDDSTTCGRSPQQVTPGTSAAHSPQASPVTHAAMSADLLSFDAEEATAPSAPAPEMDWLDVAQPKGLRDPATTASGTIDCDLLTMGDVLASQDTPASVDSPPLPPRQQDQAAPLSREERQQHLKLASTGKEVDWLRLASVHGLYDPAAAAACLGAGDGGSGGVAPSALATAPAAVEGVSELGGGASLLDF